MPNKHPKDFTEEEAEAVLREWGWIMGNVQHQEPDASIRDKTLAPGMSEDEIRYAMQKGSKFGSRVSISTEFVKARIALIALELQKKRGSSEDVSKYIGTSL